MHGARRCFVCEKNHVSRQRHTEHEIKTAAKKPKTQNPTALYTVKDFAVVFDMCKLDEVLEAEEDENGFNGPVLTLTTKNVSRSLTRRRK